MQHLLLLRHGQTDANAAGVIQGHLPTPLNALGKAQSRLLGQRLLTYTPPVTLLLTSPLVRALQTAGEITAVLQLPPQQDAAWTERHFGSDQGQPFDLVQIMTHGGKNQDPSDAEPKHTFDARVRSAVHTAPFTSHTPAVTAVVSHGGVIGSVVRQLISGHIPSTNPPTERAAVPNCSILHLRRPSPADPWHILCLHDSTHLDDLRTDLDAG